MVLFVLLFVLLFIFRFAIPAFMFPVSGIMNDIEKRICLL